MALVKGLEGFNEFTIHTGGSLKSRTITAELRSYSKQRFQGNALGLESRTPSCTSVEYFAGSDKIERGCSSRGEPDFLGTSHL